jgi:hypothetical protein
MFTKKLTWLPLFLGLVTCTPLARAEEGMVVSTARELAKQAFEDFDNGRYAESVKKFSQAYNIMRMPTLGLGKARGLTKLGKLVEASEMYLEATRLEPTDSWQPIQKEAQGEAAEERNALLPRIPRLTISIQGAKPSEVSVTVNGVALPASMIGVETLVDPGEIPVIGERGKEVMREIAPMKEGDHKELTLRFAEANATTAAPPKTNPSEARIATPKSGQVQTRSSEAAKRDNLRMLGWVGVGVGAAGVGVGAVSGLLALGKKPPGCQGSHCQISEEGRVSTYNRLLDVSTVGFIVGGVVAATGITLLLIAPKQASQPAVGVWLGPQSTGVYGGF